MLGQARTRIAVLGGALALLFLWSPPANAMQIGATVDDGGYADSVSSHLSEPASFVNGQYARTYWPSATFPNGTFFQAGYVDASNQWGSDSCQTGFGTFVTALDSSGNSVFSDLYNLGNCGLTGGQWFRLNLVSDTEYGVQWRWWHNGILFGPTLSGPTGNYRFAVSKLYTFTELVDAQDAPPSTLFPTEVYNDGIDYEPVGTSSLVQTQHADFYATSDRTCYYALRVDGSNIFRTGSKSNIDPTYCHSTGDQLW
jgi:hypothetical protein